MRRFASLAVAVVALGMARLSGSRRGGLPDAQPDQGHRHHHVRVPRQRGSVLLQGPRRQDPRLQRRALHARGRLHSERARIDRTQDRMGARRGVEPSRLRDQRQGRRRLRNDDDHARADAEGRFQPADLRGRRHHARARQVEARPPAGAQGQARRRDRRHDHRGGARPRPRRARERARCSFPSRMPPREWLCSTRARWTAMPRTAPCWRTSRCALRTPMRTRSSPAIFRTSRSVSPCGGTIPISSSR